MGQKRGSATSIARQTASDGRRAPGQRHSAEEKVRIVLKGLRGEVSITQLCRDEKISRSQYYRWSAKFLEGGKERIGGNRGKSAVATKVAGSVDTPEISRSTEDSEGRKTHHLIPRSSHPELDAELQRITGYLGAWHNIALSLYELRELDLEYEALPPTKRNPDMIRRYAIDALEETFSILENLYDGVKHTGILPTMLSHVSVALEDLKNGLNSRILLTGTLADRIPKGGHSLGWHRRVREHAAAIMEFLLRHHIERTQIGAASRVARSLDRGGYAPQGRRKAGYPNQVDTIKRWHNLARSGRDKTSGPFSEQLTQMEHEHNYLKDPHLVAEDELIRLEHICRTYFVSDD